MRGMGEGCQAFWKGLEVSHWSTKLREKLPLNGSPAREVTVTLLCPDMDTQSTGLMLRHPVEAREGVELCFSQQGTWQHHNFFSAYFRAGFLLPAAVSELTLLPPVPEVRHIRHKQRQLTSSLLPMSWCLSSVLPAPQIVFLLWLCQGCWKCPRPGRTGIGATWDMEGVPAHGKEWDETIFKVPPCA